MSSLDAAVSLLSLQTVWISSSSVGFGLSMKLAGSNSLSSKTKGFTGKSQFCGTHLLHFQQLQLGHMLCQKVGKFETL